MKFFILVILTTFSFIHSQTGTQIKEAKRYMENHGISLDEAKKIAKKKGFTERQIDKVIENEIKRERLKSRNTAAESLGLEFEMKDLRPESKTIIEKIDLKKEEIVDMRKINQKQYFGYTTFEGDPSLFQGSSAGAVDPQYTIGAGDEIIIMIWGETQFRQVVTVDREGFVFIPEIGQVFVNGLNLTLLESKLYRVLSQAYASLNPGNNKPSTFLDISLGNLRPLRIQVMGEVTQPGAYIISPSATLFSSLYYFNGPTNQGSLRNIQLIRGGVEVSSIDFYDYLLTGKKLRDQKLQLDDVIFIPRRGKTVNILGEINRPGIYELNQEESLIDIIQIAGGIKVTAFLNRMQIDRIVSFNDRSNGNADRILIDINLKEVLKSEELISVQDGDQIEIFAINNIEKNTVEITGAVSRPGVYDIGESLRISELIEKAENILGDTYLERFDVIRFKSDSTKQLLKLNLQKALDQDFEHDLILQGLDKIEIYKMSEMIEENFVSIEGHVKFEGKYSLRENMNIYDLVFQAGGFLDQKFKKRAYLDRADILRMNDDRITREIISFNLGDIINSPELGDRFLLEPDDIVRIYKKDVFISTKPVIITGAVRKPGTYELKNNMTINDLMIESGGLLPDTYYYRVELARISPKNNNLNKYAEIINFDISGDLKGADKKNLSQRLKPYDLISIRPNPYFKNQKTVKISGEVLYPRVYTIVSPKETTSDLLVRAGGFTESAYPEASELIRNDIQIMISFKKEFSVKKNQKVFMLKDGDQIIINSKSDLVKIVGLVNNPGSVKYRPKKRLRHYLDLAGGLNPKADRKNIWVEHLNGSSEVFKKYDLISPLVLDGSTIYIGEKTEIEPINRTDFAAEVASIIANIAQALAVVVIAGK